MAKPTLLPKWNENETNNTVPDSTRQNDGWVITGGIPQKPQLQFMNWYQWNVYKWIEQFNQQGVVEWDAVTTYQIGDMVKGSNGYIYQSRTAGNTNNDPVSSTTQWKLGFLNPSLVIGANSPIDSGNQLQVVDTMEVATNTGSTRQRLTITQSASIGSIDSYDENGAASLPLNLNPSGGVVAINGYEKLPAPPTGVSELNLAVADSVTHTSTLTSNLGTVSIGDIFMVFFHINGTVDATGRIQVNIQKSTGTAVIEAANTNNSVIDIHAVTGGTTVANSFNCYFEVATAGTLTLEYTITPTGFNLSSANVGMKPQLLRRSL
jgi:hypothetical protein